MDVEVILDSLGIEHYPAKERYMVCCPFHNDTNPSCGIWKDGGYFKCFACGEEGSFAEFLAEIEDISIAQAVRMLRGQDRFSDLEDSINQFLDRRDKSLKYFKWKSFCEIYPPISLGTEAEDYLTREGGKPPGRRLNAETIFRFNVRWGDRFPLKRNWTTPTIESLMIFLPRNWRVLTVRFELS